VQRVLIANRDEIALRAMRAGRILGLQSGRKPFIDGFAHTRWAKEVST
jgi:biotin carboxylase